eukprot:m.68809 g.68809  ORF g.68809 m.68809 type:complete len:508 (+) comp8258_c3_seq1:62-1585(+)
MESIHHVIRQLDQESISLYNRLRSIEYDLYFVEEVSCKYYPSLPLVANLRCGAWYHPQFDEFVHFKSSDGHRGQWQLSLKRLNLQLIPLLIQHGACLLVDSTKKGRTLPDSYSRTIPIWCAVINRVACTLKGIKIRDKYLEQGMISVLMENDTNACEKESNGDDVWDCTLYCPPTTVPEQEYDQIHSILEDRVCCLLRSGFDLSILKKLEKPIRPFWVTPVDIEFVHEDVVKDNGYLSVVCLSASKPLNIEKREFFTYIQGAGDDEEMWSMGLTAKLFWENKREILDAPTMIDCDDVVRNVVDRENGGVENAQITVLTIHNKEAMIANASTFQIGGTKLFIGNKFASVAPWCFEQYDAVINCCTACEVPNQLASSSYIQLNIPIGKRHKRELENQLCEVLKFTRRHLHLNHTILIACDTGFDRAPTVAVGIMAAFYNQKLSKVNWEHVDAEESVQSVVIPHLNKADFARCLQFISMTEPQACPSRHNMKKLNSFFLSNDVPQAVWQG